jgi:uncharacterized membrane protein (DUF2068 family)
MTRALLRISRAACPPADRRWFDALLAETQALEPGHDRFVWLLGALGFLADRYRRLLALMITPAWLTCLAATAALAYLAVIEFEGITSEDDWNFAFMALAAAMLIAVSLINLRRHPPEAWP